MRPLSRIMEYARRHRVGVCLSLLIFALTLASRAWQATPFVTFDEPAWVYRSVRFLLALRRGDLGGTLLVGHPGVLTMWSGALSLAWHWLVTGVVSGAQLAAVGAFPVLDVLDADQMRQLAALLPYAKQGCLLLHALLAVLLFVVASRALGRAEALVISALLLTDPYLLGLSRVLHIDALTAELMLLALLALGAWKRAGNPRWLILSATALAWAMLTKAYAGMLLPLGMAMLLTRGVAGACTDRRWGAGLWAGVRRVALWGAVCGGVAVAFWPAVWVNPLTVAKTVLGLSFEYATAPGDATTSFFMGQVLRDPGGWFYPVALAFRTTPLAILGLGLALVGLLPWGRRARLGPEQRRLIAWLLLYAALYLFLISLSRKKFDRYALPALLALDVVAAVGLLWAARLLWQRLAGGVWPRGGAVFALLLAAVQAGLLLAPLASGYYLAYFNPLAGGAVRAQTTLPVGWGEGLEQVGAYLSAKADAPDLTVAAWAIPGLAPYFPGRLVAPTEAGLAQADYVALYAGDAQHEGLLSELFLGRYPAENTVVRHGVRYAWLYPSPYPGWLQAQMAEEGRAGDGVLISARSALARRSLAPLTLTSWQGQSQDKVTAEVLGALSALAEHPGARLFWVDDDARAPQRAWIQQLLATNALHLWQHPYDLGALHCYQPLGMPSLGQITSLDQPVTFGDRLTLRGYGLARSEVQYRQDIGLTLEWDVLAPVGSDYQVFVHLLDAQGHKWGQRDKTLQDADLRRTTLWAAGSSVRASLNVPLQPGIVPGQYRLVMGLYRWEDGRRLEVIQGGRSLPGAELPLGNISVLPALAAPTPEELTIPYPLNKTLAPQVALLGYDLVGEPAVPGRSLDLTVWLQCTAAPLPTGATLELTLAHDGRTVWSERGLPALAGYPTSRWQTGDILAVAQEVRLPAEMATGDYELSVALLDGQGRPVAPPVALASLPVQHLERSYAVPEMTYTLGASLGQMAELLGYDLTPLEAGPGETLRLTLYWRARAAPERDLLVFVHLLDDAEAIRGQSDGRPVDGERPTGGWLPGEVLADEHRVSIAPDAPASTLRLAIGMYDSATGERLPAYDASGAPLPDGRLFLDQPITVNP